MTFRSPSGNRGVTHPQAFLAGQAQPLTPTDGSPGGRRRCHPHSTFPPGNGCAHCLLGKKERGTAGKAGGGGAPRKEPQLRAALDPSKQIGGKPPHHRPPCSCPGHWPCGRPAPVGPAAHPGPSGWSILAGPHGRAPWSSLAQRTCEGGRGRAQGRRALCPASGLLKVHNPSGLRPAVNGFKSHQNQKLLLAEPRLDLYLGPA